MLYLDFTRFADIRRNCFCDVRGRSRGSDAYLLWYSDVSIFGPALHMSLADPFLCSLTQTLY